MRNYSAKDVDAYIASMAPEAQSHLKELRKIIKAALPKVEEQISYGMPYYRYHGLLGGFMAFKSYVSYGWCDSLEPKVREVLEKKGYKTGGKTVQINFNQPVPAAEISQIVKAKAKLNEANAAQKARK